jgi:hypothetical protein
MCIVCIEYTKGKMTAKEGLRALYELEATEEGKHIEEIREKLEKLWFEEWRQNVPQTD